MTRPDYQAGSIVNLMSSLTEGLGAASTGYKPLCCLAPDEVAAYRNVVLIIVDGLGDAFFRQHTRAEGLAESRRTFITSVFPSTTATAVTTFLTGLAPQQHGLTGWHMYFRELGSILSVLPGIPRYGGCTLKQAGINVAGFFGHQPVFDRLPVHSYVISPHYIAHSDFNLAHLGQARSIPFRNQAEFFEQIHALLQSGRRGRRYIHAYWPELDRLSHEHGATSQQVLDHFRDWEQNLTRLIAGSAGSNTLFIVTADHGFIDTDDTRQIDLGDHPELASCLSLPLSGESRAAYCHVKPGRMTALRDYVCSELADQASLYEGASLIREGWFGLGEPHPELSNRVGDMVLIMNENWTIKDWLPGERRYHHRGVHGGTSDMEMKVPLIVIPA